jgi:hypothetical protein
MSNLLKIIAAFAAGVVVALGGALLYVRANEMIHPPPAVRPVLANDQLAQTPAPPAAPTAVPTPAPAPTAAPEQNAETGTVHKPVKKRAPVVAPVRDPAPVVHTPHPAPAAKIPIQIAQNTPPVPVASVTGDGNNQFSLPQPPPPSESEQPATQQLTQPAPAPITAPAQQPHTVTLPAGTNLTIRLGETLSTDHNYTGDTFRGTLVSPVIMDGFIIADRGSRVLGRIVNAEKAGHLQGAADLNLTLTQINTTDGQRVTIQTNSNDRKGPGNGGQDTTKIAGGAALGAIIGAIAGGGKGAAIGAGAGGAAGTGAVMVTHTKACVIPTEAQLSFRLAVPVTLTEKLNN